MPLSLGDQLGRYQILCQVGEGGMGEVYKARDTRLDRIVAIKRLKRANTARFEHEARAIASLNNPHICQIFDVGPDYLVLEFVEGAPFHGPLEAEQVLSLALQIVDALEAAHKRGILHRDLKPGNVMVTQSGVKLLDFGLAKLRSDPDADATHTMEGTVIGTAGFMSPEQALGRPIDERSDLFSLGALLYKVLSGRCAFEGHSTIETLSAVLRNHPAPLESPLGPIVMRCLAKDPSLRFQSAAELRAALSRVNTLSAASTWRTPSIAVLPFANMSGDKEQEYFSDGLTEEIINALVKIPGLKVIARTSAFAFKGQNADIRQIAETLGVAHVLEGSVRKSGNRIRVTAELVTAMDGSDLWSERYDRQLADVFDIQDDISESIVQALSFKLKPAAPPLPARRQYVPKLEAHEALLKARYLHWKLTPAAITQAGHGYEQAIAIDPQYALAHAEYADHLFGRSAMGITPMHESMPSVRVIAQRALQLDPSISEAHAALCMVAATYDHNWEEAEMRFSLATASGVASPWVHSVCGTFYLMAMGRLTEAFEELQRGVQGDPLHLINRCLMAICLGAAERYAEAEAQLRHALDLDANFWMTHWYLAALYAAQHRFQEALPLAEKAYSLAPWATRTVGEYAAMLTLTDERDRGTSIMQKLGSADAYGAPMAWAVYHTYCGDIDAAALWTEKLIEQRFPAVGHWLQSASAKPLRASRHWSRLAMLMNLPRPR